MSAGPAHRPDPLAASRLARTLDERQAGSHLARPPTSGTPAAVLARTPDQRHAGSHTLDERHAVVTAGGPVDRSGALRP